jgi:hypothetical protein
MRIHIQAHQKRGFDIFAFSLLEERKQRVAKWSELQMAESWDKHSTKLRSWANPVPAVY